MTKARNAMREDNGFKLGVFAYSYEGGNAITTVPERWSCRWPEIRDVIQLADRSGLDFLLPPARWRGIPGAINNRLWSFETLTLAAATAAITDRIGVFSTVHTPIIHPIVAAKAMATIDHVSGGRAGINIVCGWNKADFLMFGIPELPHDERYVQGQEWFDIWSRLLAGAPEPFDYDGKHFPELEGITGMPGSLQSPGPIVFSAAYSPAGRDFAIRTSDYLLTVAESAETGRAEIADLTKRSAKAGRETPPGCIAVAYVVCRETREEAEAFHQYYAVDNADHAGVDYYIATRKGQAALPEALYNELRARMAAGNGGYPLIGSPEDVANGIKDLDRAGFAGVALIFLNFGDELGFFVERVLPLLERAGVRSAA
ncbi:LLM class flavin-dependent oxidoreductase [Bradyrhizobium liaoningense]|uniref:LLM class flavin-dependent oxidoreductase n=1 Tax=Bradyrhizobium TaxID=374 RepID=UPI00140EE282|nr:MULTISPECIES: LLM class flavin-dependent oxidoreductase [Bradyrhizobium]MBR0739793.1 LLM class flavin-dependent oxidoreductase [Bradyrhizobium liaoningense]QIO36878.1 LLM class flavin-dependent oxidoreductase [Bradyrhizobium sp. 1(2017)]